MFRNIEFSQVVSVTCIDFVPAQEWTVNIVFDTDEDEANHPTAKWPDGMQKQLSGLTMCEWKLIREQGKKEH